MISRPVYFDPKQNYKLKHKRLPGDLQPKAESRTDITEAQRAEEVESEKEAAYLASVVESIFLSHTRNIAPASIDLGTNAFEREPNWKDAFRSNEQKPDIFVSGTAKFKDLKVDSMSAIVTSEDVSFDGARISTESLDDGNIQVVHEEMNEAGDQVRQEFVVGDGFIDRTSKVVTPAAAKAVEQPNYPSKLKEQLSALESRVQKLDNTQADQDPSPGNLKTSGLTVKTMENGWRSYTTLSIEKSSGIFSHQEKQILENVTLTPEGIARKTSSESKISTPRWPFKYIIPPIPSVKAPTIEIVTDRVLPGQSELGLDLNRWVERAKSGQL